MSKVLGIDYGSKRVGIAVSDEDRKYSFMRETIINISLESLVNEIKEVCVSEKVEKIVMGLPLDQNGNIGPKAKEVTEFARYLHNQLKIEVILEDERFTSIMAKQLFREAGKKLKKEKINIDKQSAQIILQSFLDKKNG